MSPNTKLEQAEIQLKKVSEQLHRIERKTAGLSDFATALSQLSNVLSVTISEVKSLQKEVASVSAGLGELELKHQQGEDS